MSDDFRPGSTPEGGERSTPTSLNEQASKPEKNLSNVIVVGLIVAAFKKTIGQRHRFVGAVWVCGNAGPQCLVIVHSHGTETEL